jgi:hypothetical protein
MKYLPSSLWMVTGASVLKTPITAIINQLILSGKVPNSKKPALFKKNSPLDVGNYRSVIKHT